MHEADRPLPRPLASWRVPLQLPDAESFIVRKSELLVYYSILRAGWEFLLWMDAKGTALDWASMRRQGEWREILGYNRYSVDAVARVIDASLTFYSDDIARGDWSTTEAMLFAAWPDYQEDKRFMRSLRVVNDARVRKNVRPEESHYQIVEATMRIRASLLDGDRSFQEYWQSGAVPREWVAWATAELHCYRQLWAKRQREHAEWLKTQVWVGPDGREYPDYLEPGLRPEQPTWESQGAPDDWRYIRLFRIADAEWRWEGDNGDRPARADEWKLVRGDPKGLEAIIASSETKPADMAATVTSPQGINSGEQPPPEMRSSNRYVISMALNRVLITDSHTGETKVLDDETGNQYGIAFTDLKPRP